MAHQIVDSGKVIVCVRERENGHIGLEIIGYSVRDDNKMLCASL